MSRNLAKLMVVLLTLSVAIPESQAKRMGGGRSSARQAPIARQRSTPPQPPRSTQAVPPPGPSAPPQSRPAPVEPIASRPATPVTPQPLPPQRTLPQQAASPWGGMLGGALIGLGLGSLISRGNDGNSANQNESSGTSGAGGENERAGGASADDGNQQGTLAPEAGSHPLGSLLLLGLLAMGVFFVARRMRRNRIK